MLTSVKSYHNIYTGYYHNVCGLVGIRRREGLELVTKSRTYNIKLPPCESLAHGDYVSM